MMRLIKNSEPVFHKHICADYKTNTEISDEELHNFTVEVLMKEYESTGVTVHKINKINGNEADFNFCSHDRSVNEK